MIKPVLQDDEFLADVRAARREPNSLHLWWLGQSGFLIQWRNCHLLLDPYLSDSLTRKYAATDKPHVRMTERVVAPERLNFIEVVTSSHNHTDHLDADTLRPLLDANPDLRLVIPAANRQFVLERLADFHLNPRSSRREEAQTARSGEDALDRLVEVDDGQTVTVAGCEFTGVAAAHETVERDEAGHCRFLGYVIQLGPWRLYHSGDTVLHDGLVERLRKYSVDIALLPINGRAPERRVAGNLNGREAAGLAQAIGAARVIPCHYEMFEFNTTSPDDFEAECERLGQPYVLLRCGERWTGRTDGPNS
jgi:L-ascorbate metabolism protein UlaG (beta-lactamase superfamily)